MDNIVKETASLIRQAARAHHQYQEEQFGGVRQANWHPWYANHMLENGLADILGVELTQDQVAQFLVEVEKEYDRLRPDQKWPDYYAQKMVAALA